MWQLLKIAKINTDLNEIGGQIQISKRNQLNSPFLEDTRNLT